VIYPKHAKHLILIILFWSNILNVRISFVNAWSFHWCEPCRRTKSKPFN